LGRSLRITPKGLPPILELRHITKRFPGVLALDAVDLEVQAGEVLGLIGENGAGKSTLMKVLGGICQADEGDILLDGKPVAVPNVSAAVRLGIAFIHQDLNVLDNLDVAANVFLGREPVWGGIFRLIDRNRIYSETERYLSRLEADISPRALLKSLSIAQQQMVEIAKALSLNAQVLIMDEPSSCLTLSETERLLKLVRDLKAGGVSIIYITHRLGEIEACADRVVALRDGRNAGSLSREEVSHDRMVQLMIGRDIETYYSHGKSKREPGYFEVRGLRTTAFPEQTVSFEVGRGEILGIAGLVGAGRSEVVRAIFGVDPRLGGAISLNRCQISICSPRDAIRHGVYLLPEDRRKAGLIGEMTVRENVTLPSLRRYAQAWLLRRDLESAVASVQCGSLNVRTPSIETKVANLSGGNQQKVALGKWLPMEPKVMIFDEPTRGIDVGAKAEIYRLMRGLADRGVAIVMVSSEMEEILGVSDRVAVMREGAITGILERKDCTEEAVMRLAVGAVAAGKQETDRNGS
jgi:ribose transport system ATP-binding protein